MAALAGAVAAPATVRDVLVAAARAAWPREACGLLAGPAADDPAAVTTALPLPNVATAADRFEVAPWAFAAAEAALRARGERLLGFFHSHRDGPPVPSATDRQQLWPDCLQVLVVAPPNAPPALAAFTLRGGAVHAVALEWRP